MGVILSIVCLFRYWYFGLIGLHTMSSSPEQSRVVKSISVGLGRIGLGRSVPLLSLSLYFVKKSLV